MLTIIFSLMMITIFGKILFLAIRLAWGAVKILLSLVFLPAILIFIFAAGLVEIAIPVLAVIGLITLLTPKANN